MKLRINEISRCPTTIRRNSKVVSRKIRMKLQKVFLMNAQKRMNLFEHNQFYSFIELLAKYDSGTASEANMQ